MSGTRKLRTFFRENGLSLTMFGLFLLFAFGQALAGYSEYSDDQRHHGQPTPTFSVYLRSGHFLESVFENWESEFFQMGAYIILTAYLFQKGSAESKDPDQSDDEEAKLDSRNPDAPLPVRMGGFICKLYQHSLSLAFLVLFLLSLGGHMLWGVQHYNEERLQQGEAAVSALEYLKSSRFWFESFQNWQSEFLAVFAIIFLSIWLREKGSPESKEVTARHKKTGK